MPQDWNASGYDTFSAQRLRPALDLLAQVRDLPKGDIVDLGCGSGNVGPDLRLRFGDRRTRNLIGVDQSESMLDKAKDRAVYDRLDQADVMLWTAHDEVALIFSNALLHWLPNHDTLIPRLAQMLSPQGVLAVQVSNQNSAPSHRLWVELGQKLYPDALQHVDLPQIPDMAVYADILDPLGSFDLWRTEYVQTLPAVENGHPVRLFSETTFARPILNALNPPERHALTNAYDEEVAKDYPVRSDGSVLFPFRRVFFVLRVPG